MENLILSPISKGEFLEDFRQIIKEEISNYFALQTEGKSEEVLLTGEEVSKKLQVSLVTLWNWRCEGLIKSYTIGTRVRYKLSDIEEALLSNSVGPKKTKRLPAKNSEKEVAK